MDHPFILCNGVCEPIDLLKLQESGDLVKKNQIEFDLDKNLMHFNLHEARIYYGIEM